MGGLPPSAIHAPTAVFERAIRAARIDGPLSAKSAHVAEWLASKGRVFDQGRTGYSWGNAPIHALEFARLLAAQRRDHAPPRALPDNGPNRRERRKAEALRRRGR